MIKILVVLFSMFITASVAFGADDGAVYHPSRGAARFKAGAIPINIPSWDMPRCRKIISIVAPPEKHWDAEPYIVSREMLPNDRLDVYVLTGQNGTIRVSESACLEPNGVGRRQSPY